MSEFRRPPQNLEAEISVLGGILLEPELLPEVIRVLAAPDFFRDSHQHIFEAMCDLFAAGAPLSLVTLHDELQRAGTLAEAGGWDYVADLVAQVPHSANTVYHAQIVRAKAVSRGTVELAAQMLTDAYSDRYTAEELLSRAFRALLALQEVGRVRQFAELRTMAAEVVAELEQRGQGDVLGLTTGFLDLDHTLGGLRAAQLVIVAGRPGSGKSAFAGNLCDHVAVDCGLSVLFVSLEMTGHSLAERMVIARAKLDSHKALVGHLGPAELDRARDAARQLEQTVVFFDDSPSLSAMQLLATARSIAIRQRIGLVILDYIGLVAPEDAKLPRHEQVAQVSRGLKALARELKIPVVALAQLNRQVEAREDHRPRLSDLRESGQIEADADVVLLLHRPEYYDPNDQPGVAELGVAKNRNGITGTVKLTFVKHAMRFENAAAMIPPDEANGAF